MISLYTHKAAVGSDEVDQWLRKPALIVLIYEGKYPVFDVIDDYFRHCGWST